MNGLTEAFSNPPLHAEQLSVEGMGASTDLDELKKSCARRQRRPLVIRDPDENEAVPVLMDNRARSRIRSGDPLLAFPGEMNLILRLLWLRFSSSFSDLHGRRGLWHHLVSTGLFISRKLKLAGMGKQLVDLLFWGGIASVVFGIVFGGYLGDFLVWHLVV